jgi:hypothetical protein
MPRTTKSKKQSIADLLSKDIGGGVFRRDGNTVFCKVCVNRLNTITKFTLESHIKTQLHENLVKRKQLQQRQIDGDGFILNSQIDSSNAAISQSTFM